MRIEIYLKRKDIILIEKERLMEKKIMEVGVVGAGMISDIYISNMSDVFENLHVKGVCAKHFERAQAKALQYNIKVYTLEEMLKDPEIEMMVILTPVDTHYAIIKSALEAGKHVYTEKTIAETAKQAKELSDLADQKGLYLGSAPDTFLGSSLQTVRKAIDDGVIGEVNSFSIAVNRNNDYYTAYYPFLCLPGAGVLRDYLVYYMTALVSILGPVEKLGAFVRTPYKKRVGTYAGTPVYGKEYDTPNESIISAIMQLKNGMTGTVHQDHESLRQDQASFVIYGTKGMILLGNPDEFGNPVRIKTNDSEGNVQERTLDVVGAYSDNSRGVGPAEMADAIFHKRKNRASKELAYHVLDVLETIERSDREGGFVTVASTCDRPEAFPESL